MKNSIIAFTVLTLVLASCSEPNIKKKVRMLQYNCSNDFTVSFEEETTVTDEDSTTAITVSVDSKNFDKKLKMEQVRSASGVKYATKDGKYIYWEHQGEVIFGTEDSTYCLCK
jgi:membrane-bound inhibitor of C-type lysozyme